LQGGRRPAAGQSKRQHGHQEAVQGGRCGRRYASVRLGARAGRQALPQWRAQGLKVVYSKIQKAKQNGYFIPIINIYTLSYTFRYYKLTKIFGIQ